MPRCAALLVLALLSPLSGCHALEGEVVTYRPGTPPATTTAKCDAAYTLYAPDPQVACGTVDIPKGATVGFRREPDGALVAIVGEQITPIPDEPAAWRYASKPFGRWDRFTAAVRKGCMTAVVVVVAVPLFPLVCLWILTGHEVP